MTTKAELRDKISRLKIANALLSEEIGKLRREDVSYPIRIWHKNGDVIRMTINYARSFYGLSKDWPE